MSGFYAKFWEKHKMDRIKVSFNFYLDEFIDPITYSQYGANSIWFIDQRIITIAQLLRDISGKPVTINNWLTGGYYKESGLRRPATNTGAYLSLHKFGKAIDPKVKDLVVPEVHHLIHAFWPRFKEAGLTTIEDLALTPSWTHMDCRQTNLKEILIVKPKSNS